MRVVHAPGMPRTFSPPPTSRKPLVSHPGMHHGTRVAHVPLCMSGSLIHVGGEDVPDIPSACATRNFKYLIKGLWWGRQQICHSLASGWHANPTFVPVYIIYITLGAPKNIKWSSCHGGDLQQCNFQFKQIWISWIFVSLYSHKGERMWHGYCHLCHLYWNTICSR